MRENRQIAKVPVVMQMEALECGAACLAMVLAYYGKWVPLEQVREDCGVSRDGSKAGNIVKAAIMYGLEAGGYRMEPEALKREGTFPCIVHWEFNHFIVVRGFKKGKVYINDPARGSITLSEEEFDRGFTGVGLLFSKGEGFVRSGRKKSVLAFAKKRMEGTGPAVAFVVLTTIISSIAAIISTGFSRMFLDQLLTGRDAGLLMPFTMGLIFFTVLRIMALWIQAIYSLKINGKMAVVGNSTFFWHVLRLPMKFFSQRRIGDIELRRRDNASIAESLVNTFAPLVLDTAMMLFYLIVMLRYSVLLTLVGISSMLFNIFISRIISEKRVNITRVLMQEQGRLYSDTVSGIEMIETIKASGAENGYFRRWAGRQARVNVQNVHFSSLDYYLGSLPLIFQAIVGDAVLIIGIYLTMKGSFTPGMILAFQGFLASFLSPMGSLVTAGQRLQEMRTEMERLEDVMAYPVQISEKEDKVAKATSIGEPQLLRGSMSDVANVTAIEGGLSKLSGELVIRNVSFGYSKLDKPLIQDFSLELPKGKSVALVGASGCGKSTLSRLITGLYEPWEGEILFDGKPIQDIDRAVFTGSVAVVDQDITLFEDTISNNIKMWDQSIEDFEVIMAARDAHLHEDIMQRIGDYQYKLQEGGRDLSGGQRQRLEIARVLSQDPTIIIMDEATSALDARTEAEVVNSIRQRGITTVVIAHRLSTIRDCDEIIVMDHGRAVERGTHSFLMEKGGFYKELVAAE
ncbi:MAG: NHLP family bacteriocin export ABC transporter peptidase/permease/ATPase subunit [Lachnospiraceae bacterium]|nr:NHLP family bacteriocin export ABC transporter peptidase/permease/ATPase subunit [Lachnospiraceae bacterium]